MVRLTIEHGFCEDSIIGLVTAGYGLFSFTEEVELGYRIGKIGESLISESKNRHALRSRLCFQLEGTLKVLVEPVQSVVPLFIELYNSAMQTGNVQTERACEPFSSTWSEGAQWTHRWRLSRSPELSTMVTSENCSLSKYSLMGAGDALL